LVLFLVAQFYKTVLLNQCHTKISPVAEKPTKGIGPVRDVEAQLLSFHLNRTGADHFSVKPVIRNVAEVEIEDQTLVPHLSTERCTKEIGLALIVEPLFANFHLNPDQISQSIVKTVIVPNEETDKKVSLK